MVENKDIQNKTDEELAGLARTNPDFYMFLMERYEEKILRYIQRMSSVTTETAQDLGQEIFLKAYQNINDFDLDLKFSSWLYRIAHNHVISFWRRNKKEKNVVSWDENENLKNMLESDDDITKDIDDKIKKERLGEVLGQIKPVYREVLVLKYMEGKDYKEISDIIKKPMGTVGTLISRAKAEIRKKILENNINI
jgi:RNA polymerase sigma-70 factor, ECF subfamily